MTYPPQIRRIIFHNAKFDLQLLLSIGVTVPHIFNTMLTAQLQYAALDAAVLLKLYELMVPLLSRNGLNQIADTEFSCVPALAHTEYCGVHLDLDRWNLLPKRTEHLYEEALQTLYTYSGTPTYQLNLWGGEESLNVNFESKPYVLKLLNRYGISVKSTSRRSLAPYRGNPLVKALGDYRRYAKSLSSFLNPIPTLIHPADGRLHPKYMQIGAWSGRMSCYDPNIQQIPRKPISAAVLRPHPGRR